MMTDRKNLIPIIVALIVIGALIYRDYPRVGLWVTIVALASYIIADVRKNFARIRNYKHSSRRERVKLTMTAIMTLILLCACISGNIYYFMTLVVLAVDFMMNDKKVLK